MAKLMFGKLSEAWKGEATDFTPLLADQLDNLGDALGIDLAAVGKSEVLTTGGRRIDIVAQGADGSEFVIENQYGKADHDHLTRGLAYAVARHSVVLDATWGHREERRRVKELAGKAAAELAVFECQLSPDEVARRISGRVGVSDADEDVARRLRAELVPWAGSHHVDTSGPPTGSVDLVCEALGYGRRPAVSRPRPRMAPD